MMPTFTGKSLGKSSLHRLAADISSLHLLNYINDTLNYLKSDSEYMKSDEVPHIKIHLLNVILSEKWEEHICS